MAPRGFRVIGATESVADDVEDEDVDGPLEERVDGLAAAVLGTTEGTPLIPTHGVGTLVVGYVAALSVGVFVASGSVLPPLKVEAEAEVPLLLLGGVASAGAGLWAAGVVTPVVAEVSVESVLAESALAADEVAPKDASVSSVGEPLAE